MRQRLALTTLALATAVTAGVAAPASAARPDPVRQGLETLVDSDRAPGALASVLDGKGKFRTHTAGVGDRDTQAKMPRNAQVRIGSVTKSFTAAVVLQLVGEGEISLDKPVDKYLPGLVRGKGIDGHLITVRQLLQHTSGLPDYEDDVTNDILERRYLSPRDALDIALKHKALFKPGKKWSYSNTNYLVAGLIVERVTGRPLAEQIDKRVIQKLGLRHTYFPAPGETTLRERHPQGYRPEPGGAPARNVTGIGSLRGLGGRRDGLDQLRPQPLLLRAAQGRRQPSPQEGPAQAAAHHHPHAEGELPLRHGTGDHAGQAVRHVHLLGPQRRHPRLRDLGRGHRRRPRRQRHDEPRTKDRRSRAAP
ncbi:serine hydrolase domain-containing protein [Streptomyces sp. PmtG]